MKKALMILLLLFISFSLFAWKELDFAASSQSILAYINGVFELEVTEFYYTGSNNGKGLNLNINDDTNNFRYLLSPTQAPKTVPGLLVANFSLISSSSNYRLTIAHDKLKNDGDASIKYDYELCTIYSVQVGNTMVKRTVYSLAQPESAVLDFNENQGILMLQNAGLYMRLCTEITDGGTYSSVITLQLESLQ